MPEELVLDLPPVPVGGTFARLEAQAETIEHLLSAIELEVAGYIDSLQGSARVFEEVWQRFIHAVVAGQTERVQATREKTLAGLQMRLDLLESIVRVALLLRPLPGRDRPDADVLRPEITALKRLKAKVFDRWQTVEDLEVLVAEHTAPTEKEFDAVARKYGPPTAWFEQCGEPRSETP